MTGNKLAIKYKEWFMWRIIALTTSILLLIVFLNSWDYFPFVDEVENLYDAFLVSRGLIPYRDYFTNHLPGVHFLFSPVFLVLDPFFSNYQLHFFVDF